jgi:hypothetical protein
MAIRRAAAKAKRVLWKNQCKTRYQRIKKLAKDTKIIKDIQAFPVEDFAFDVHRTALISNDYGDDISSCCTTNASCSTDASCGGASVNYGGSAPSNKAVVPAADDANCLIPPTNECLISDASSSSFNNNGYHRRTSVVSKTVLRVAAVGAHYRIPVQRPITKGERQQQAAFFLQHKNWQ